MAKMSDYPELKIKAQKSNMRARTLAKAIEAVYGKGTTEVLTASEQYGDTSGAIVRFKPCENFGIESFLDPMDGGPFFMSLHHGEPMAEFKTVPQGVRMVSAMLRSGVCSRR